MISGTTDAIVSIPEMRTLIVQLRNRVRQSLISGTGEPGSPAILSLRHKPNRGLVVLLQGGGERRTRSRSTDEAVSDVPAGCLLSVVIDESILAQWIVSVNQPHQESVEQGLDSSGVLPAAGSRLTIQEFPTDNGLPALVSCVGGTRNQALWEGLQAAARVYLCDQAWQLRSFSVEPVSYKPSDRCVLRYYLSVERDKVPGSTGPTLKDLQVIGKVYADPQQERAVHDRVQQLYLSQLHTDRNRIRASPVSFPILPRPLGSVDKLGLMLSEAVGSGEGKDKIAARLDGVLPGLRALRPQRKPKGAAGEWQLPATELRLAAIALARLHTSVLSLDGVIPRTGIHEAKRARDRATSLATYYPAQAGEILDRVHQLTAHLEVAIPETHRPVHGGYKPSQLLFHDQRVFVVDFDGLCLGDAAIDVGYFLAYLRPRQLWVHRPDLRLWFGAASAAFRSGYYLAMTDAGVREDEIKGIVERSRLYEAAILFKIAARRVHRLHSPRPRELAAMLTEIEMSLFAPNGRTI